MEYRKRNYFYWILFVIAVSIPFLYAFFLTAFSGHSLFSVVPFYEGGDAVTRYRYIASLLEHGKVLGYYGYDGGTAVIGNLGNPWGIGWTVPYLLVGVIFGWDLNTPIMANIFFLCIANLLFIFLTKCNKKSIVYIILINIVLFVNINYAVSAMSECSRYAITIILIGMLYRMMFLQTSKWFRFGIVPLTIVIAAGMYIILSGFVILYCMIIFEKKRFVYRGILSVSIFLVFTLAVQKINLLFATPYYQKGTIDKIIDAFKSGIASGVKESLSIFVHNLSAFDLIAAVRSADWSYGWYTWFVFLCYGLIGVISYNLMKKKLTSRKDRIIAFAALYLLLVFILGHLVLYNDVQPTLIRGINTAVCGAAFMSVLMTDKRIAHFFLIGSLLWGAQFLIWMNDSLDKEYMCYSEEQLTELEEQRTLLSSYIQLSETAEPWENTIALYYIGGGNALALPIGIGENSMISVEVNEKAKYALIGNGADEEMRKSQEEMLLENNHRVLVDTDDFVLMENMKFK